MTHKRSRESEARRYDRWQRQLHDWEAQFTKHYDRLEREVISLDQCVAHGIEKSDPLVIVDAGEVLSDQYGRGTFQNLKVSIL